MDSHLPLVSIICTSYNHEKFIAQALNGFVMQKTTFPFEIIVHEDASTDSTANIVREYEARFPHLFANIYQNENQFSRSKNIVTKITFAVALGKYIALCDGDDYWMDPYKLQKQVDFLEANEDFAICFHEAFMLYEDGKKSLFNNIDENRTFDFLDLTQKNFISTASCVFRVYKHHHPMPDWFFKLSAGDWGLHLLNASKGKIFYLKDCMSVYRIQNQGVWSSLTPEQMCNKGIEMMEQLNAAFDYKYNDYFEKAKTKRLVNFNMQTLKPVIHRIPLLTKLKRKIKNYLS